MTARLPTVGGDDGSWGTILNTYLAVEHESDGTHKSAVYKPAGSADVIVAASDSAANVKRQADYICDGTGDDVDILAALNTSGIKKVFLHVGTYNLTHKLTIPTGVMLEGAGWGTALNMAGITSSGGSSILMNNNCILSNLKVYASISPLTAIPLGIVTGNHCQVNHVWMDSIDYGITSSAVHDVQISHCRFSNVKSSSTFAACLHQVGDIDAIFIHDIWIEDCDRGIETENGAQNISVKRVAMFNVNNTALDVHTHVGSGNQNNIVYEDVYLENCAGVSVSGVNADNYTHNVNLRNITLYNHADTYGAVVQWADGVLIDGLRIYGTFANATYALAIQNAKSVKIANLRTSGISDKITDISMTNSTAVNFDGGFIDSTATTGYALRFDMTTCTDVMIQNMYVRHGGTGGFYPYGASGTARVTIQNCTVEKSSGTPTYSLVPRGITNASIIGNSCTGSAISMYIYGDVAGAKICRNICDKAIQIASGATSVEVFSNTIAADGVADAGTGSRIYNNNGNGARQGPVWAFSTANVSNPPTDQELDTAFGTPANLGTGFIGVLDDNNAHTNIWLCAVIGTEWWYVALTKAA